MVVHGGVGVAGHFRHAEQDHCPPDRAETSVFPHSGLINSYIAVSLIFTINMNVANYEAPWNGGIGKSCRKSPKGADS
jgi:hypothetical protein